MTHEDVLKLARLARLSLSDEEAEEFRQEIIAILKYVEQLQDVSLDGVAPTSQVTGLINVVRPDEIKDYNVTPDALLANAPALEDSHIKVRKMI